ncbi:hypothetical protein ACFX1Z_024418 [Malus domestica]
MNLPDFFPPLLEDEVRDLNAQVDNSAIKDCLFAIGPPKDPGIDGFLALISAFAGMSVLMRSPLLFGIVFSITEFLLV